MLEMFIALLLVATTLFAYFHGEYGTAVVAGVCAGFVGGIAFTRLIVQRREREHDAELSYLRQHDKEATDLTIDQQVEIGRLSVENQRLKAERNLHHN